MHNETFKKFLQFATIIIFGILADQWTKSYASDRLAGSSSVYTYQHSINFVVSKSSSGETVKQYLGKEFTWNKEPEVARIAQYFTRVDGVRARSDQVLKEGQNIEVLRREVVLVKDYWDFVYARNPGAAFSFLADQSSTYRLPFFIIMSIIAFGVILHLVHGLMFKQQLLIWSLSFIAAGACGNFIDRIRFGYVIDFILWKYTDEYRWPVFNIADTLICIGVGLMVIELIRDAIRQRREGVRDDAKETTKTSVVLEDNSATS